MIVLKKLESVIVALENTSGALMELYSIIELFVILLMNTKY